MSSHDAAIAPDPEHSPRVLIVDDEPSLRLMLAQALSSFGYDILFAADGETAFSIFREASVDCIVSDLHMPGMGGMELMRQAREVDPDVALIVLTGAGNLEDAIEALRLHADDFLQKPVELRAVRLAVDCALRRRKTARVSRENGESLEERVRERAAQLERTYAEALLTLASAIEVRDGYTARHVERVTRYAVATGEALGLDADEIRSLWVAGILHDIGKIGMPDTLLSKREALTSEEHRAIQQHPVVGARIAAQCSSLVPAIPGIRHHHERWDGGGYPDGLAGEAIPMIGRILSVAESYDAITTDRPYQRRRAPEIAADELRRCAGSQFDPRVVEAFLRAMSLDDPRVYSLDRPPTLLH
jgi:response regulator RpfG family c-di-GMP phosphodiesterase